MNYNFYMMCIDSAKDIDQLEAIIEEASNSEEITSEEYSDLYGKALYKIQARDWRT